MSNKTTRVLESIQIPEQDVCLNEMAVHYGENLDKLHSEFAHEMAKPELKNLNISHGDKVENVIRMMEFECSGRRINDQKVYGV